MFNFPKIVCFILTLMLPVLGFAKEPITEIVKFAGPDGQVELIGKLSKPAGDPPYPAIVFLHGCSGLGLDGQTYPTYTAWAEHFSGFGYVVLMVDSATPRSFASTCGPGKARRVMYANRPGDAYRALEFLQTQAFIRSDKIALMGWSQGGGVALLTMVSQSIGRPSPPPKHDFKAAVALYPSACSDHLQSKPFTQVEPHSWSTSIPLLVLQGGADNWTKPGPCKQFIEGARKRGQPVSIKIYEEAHHSFDAPDMPLRQRLEVLTKDGMFPIVGTNEPARQDALAQVGSSSTNGYPSNDWKSAISCR